MKDSSSYSMSSTSLNDYTKAVSDAWMNSYTNPFITTSNWTFNSLAWSPQLETNSNELKINIKKRYIKFNFNL